MRVLLSPGAKNSQWWLRWATSFNSTFVMPKSEIEELRGRNRPRNYYSESNETSMYSISFFFNVLVDNRQIFIAVTQLVLGRNEKSGERISRVEAPQNPLKMVIRKFTRYLGQPPRTFLAFRFPCDMTRPTPVEMSAISCLYDYRDDWRITFLRAPCLLEQ